MRTPLRGTAWPCSRPSASVQRLSRAPARSRPSACIASATPPGWFEMAAVEAVSQWRFDPPAEIGPRRYRVTIKFRMGD